MRTNYFQGSLRGILASFAFFFITANAFAAPEALNLKYDLDLDDFRGRTFLATMLAEPDGIVAEMDADWDKTTYEFPDWEEVQRALDNFDTKNTRRVRGAFGYSESDIEKFTKKLEGKPYKPSDIVNLIRGPFFAYVDEKYQDEKKRTSAKKNTNPGKPSSNQTWRYSLCTSWKDPACLIKFADCPTSVLAL